MLRDEEHEDIHHTQLFGTIFGPVIDRNFFNEFFLYSNIRENAGRRRKIGKSRK